MDFVGEPTGTPIHAKISGVGGPIAVLLKGMVMSIEEDFGRTHSFRIPGIQENATLVEFNQ